MSKDAQHNLHHEVGHDAEGHDLQSAGVASMGQVHDHQDQVHHHQNHGEHAETQVVNHLPHLHLDFSGSYGH